MNQHEGKRLYRSVSDCFVSIVRVEGVLALWKGLLPVYLRQASHRKASLARPLSPPAPGRDLAAPHRPAQAPFNLLNYLVLEQLTQTFLGRTIM